MSEHKLEDGVNVVVDEIEHFFLEAESLVEKIIFGKRLWVLLVFVLVTVYLASTAAGYGLFGLNCHQGQAGCQLRKNGACQAPLYRGLP